MFKPHSPGPYVVSRLHLRESSAGFIEDADGRLIAHTCTAADENILNCTPAEFRAGNLHLLAASWNLLKACKSVLAAVCDLDPRLVESLRNAIAAAEGEDEAQILEFDYSDVDWDAPLTEEDLRDLDNEHPEGD